MRERGGIGNDTSWSERGEIHCPRLVQQTFAINKYERTQFNWQISLFKEKI